jgi:RHS repeat-associated protein
MAYADPDAVTQIANGLSTTTFSYDADGNVTQKTVDGTTTTYVYDYANRLAALGVGGATTTYGYDAFGTRVLQTGTTTTTIYPFKWYSVASSTGTGAKYATTTDYVFNGDTLLATVDQQSSSGIATGTAKTRYVHPDHLGSTNVVTDENGNAVETLDYFPYGGTRLSVGTSTRERRQFIGQFTDDSTLSYLNARFYEGSRGQFLSEDPAFLGDPRSQNIGNPQSLNAYSYAEDNPISKSDPSGKCIEDGCVIEAAASLGFAGGVGLQAYHDVTTGDWRTRSLLQDFRTYGAAGVGGAVIAGGTAVAGVGAALAEFGALSSGITVGGTAGILTDRTELAQNSFLGRPTDAGQLLLDTAIATFGGGALSFLPGVAGALPQSLKAALSIFSEQHAARAASQEFVWDSAQIFGGAIYQLYSSNSVQQRSSAASTINSTLGLSTVGGGGGSGPNPNSLWTTPSGAVVTWGGSLVVGPTANSTPATK